MPERAYLRRSVRSSGQSTTASLPLVEAQVHYSLAHRASSRKSIPGVQKEIFTRYAAAPIVFTRPERGVQRLSVTCPACQKKVTVVVRSPVAVRLERWKRGAYVVLITLAFYALAALIPWHSFLGNNDACVGLLALFAFGFAALYNGAQVIAPEATLLVELVRRPFLDILPSLGRQEAHTILRRKT